MEWELGAGLNGVTASVSGDDQLVTIFRWEAIENTKKSTEVGYPQFDDVEFVTISVPGAKDSLYDGPVTDKHKSRFAKRYEHWKTGAPTPCEGLPLKEWPVLTKARVKELESVGIYSVEQLSNVPDSLTHRLGLFGSQTRQKAKDWLANASTGALSSSLRAENDRLKDELAELQRVVKGMKAQYDSMGQGQVSQVQAAPIDINAIVQAAVSAALAARPISEPIKQEKVETRGRPRKYPIRPTREDLLSQPIKMSDTGEIE